MTPSKIAWATNLSLHVALIGVLVAAGPLLWLPTLPLLIVLPWLLRRNARAHAFNTLMVLWYIGVALVFRDTTTGLLTACLGAAVFLASVAFVRFQAVERRRAAG